MEKERKEIFRESFQGYYKIKEVKKIIFDINILIDYANGYAKWLENLLKDKQPKAKLILPTIVIAEYFTSTALEEEYEVKIVERTFSLFTKQDLTEDIAKILGRILRRKTYPPSADLADLIIASTTIYLKGELATKNRSDFAKIPNLDLFDPKELKN